MQEKLKDPILNDIHRLLERDESIGCFLQLYKYGLDGKLEDKTVFKEICKMFADFVRRSTDSENPKLVRGQRYSRDFLQFMILMRSSGGDSARQYGLLTSQIGGPSARHLRYEFWQ